VFTARYELDQSWNRYRYRLGCPKFATSPPFTLVYSISCMSRDIFRQTVRLALPAYLQSGKFLIAPLLRVHHTTLLRESPVFCYKHRKQIATSVDSATNFWMWPVGGVPRHRSSHSASRIVRLWAAAWTVTRCWLPVGSRASPETATSGSLSAHTVLFFLVFNSPVLKPDLNLKENQASFIYSLFNHDAGSSDSKRRSFTAYLTTTLAVLTLNVVYLQPI
jgi:hypothetical protein